MRGYQDTGDEGVKDSGGEGDTDWIYVGRNSNNNNSNDLLLSLL